MNSEIKEIVGLANNALKDPQKYNCIAGVSLGVTEYSNKPKVKAYIGFLVKSFDRILIFINDYNYHWDLMAFQNLNKEQALKKAKRMGKELKNNYKNTFTKYFSKEKNKNRFRIITFFELLEDKKFQEFYEIFNKILQENKEIRKKIERDLDYQIFNTISIKEKLKSIKKDNPSFYHSITLFAKNYILDQLIANLFLMFKFSIVYNIRVSLTPYSQFITFKNLLEDKYNNFKEKLNIVDEFGVISGIHLEKT